LQVQIFGKPKIIAKIPATHFHPSPKVESAILVIEIYSEPLIPEKDIATFFKIMYAGFCHKRKKLTNNLKSINGLTTEKIKGVFTELNLSENTRAQELTIEQWENLINLITR
ncbi:MAG: 16S rRNA methyltransferase, partial [Candidatus Peregrinibacteria bacterium GW2011_GWE2_39_6]